MKYILSFGGGLNSSALLVWLVENHKPLDLVLFSDTMDEHERTYKAIEYYKNFCKEMNVPFETVSRGSLYDYCYDKKIIPSRMKRDCTSKFKVTPIRKRIKELFPKEQFVMYIGIVYDEAHRVRTSDVKYITNEYPFVDEKIDRQGCIHYLQQRGLMIPEKSGCYYCPFSKKQEWIDLIDKRPDLIIKAIALEENGSRFPEFTLTSKRLREIRDNKVNQKSLVDYEQTCDVSGSCFL